ncbi:RecQ family ATP-dependent DNA helicase [Desulfotalea psychrophila]|nr:RecQ family ATP-dependent DNA helicase [Desulfotalea psychrophila]
MKERAIGYLRNALNKPEANFRDGQWESIEQLLNNKRVLVVQRTGWGKSMVYFLATKLLREQGAGPTLLISPLLSLMRNQVEAATRIGVRAKTINSTNNEEWDTVQTELEANQVDVLLISPEKLGNDDFRQNILSTMADKVGLFVVDEAHCISDWGHDFRPKYRQIVRVLQALPSNIPVLATTATANNRVVDDVKSQLGDDIELIRGSLVRQSLRLQNITMPSSAARLAWLAQTIPKLPASGIVYTLTKRDADRVTEWLQLVNIDAKAYYNGVPNREDLEQQLFHNEVKVLVATVALGMGFDKPDLGFVIHFQRPSSVVHYYQQVGRAGRAVEEAYGILLSGTEDDQITDFFIRSAFPPQKHISEVIRVLDESNDGLSSYSMEKVLNLRTKQIMNTIDYLAAESPAPVVKVGTKWNATATASTYRINQENIDAITAIRRQEQQQMHEYMQHTGCLMAFLQDALDDPAPQNCGKCQNCAPELRLDESYDNDLANKAGLFLRRSYQPVKAKKKWPPHNPLPTYNFSGMIRENLIASEGRALSLWRDAGWGELIYKGKYEDNHFSDVLVTACVEMLREWAPEEAPKWVTCIPSINHPDLVPNFAKRLARALEIPFVDCVVKVQNNQQQKTMENSFQQARNLDGVFKVNLESRAYSPCLLIDDMVDSGWTFTVAAALLRQVGCTAVYPLALALNS